MAHRLSCGEFCSLFCCPPFPTKIAAKLAFQSPESTYTMTTYDKGVSYNIHLAEAAEFQYTTKELESIDVIKAKNRRGHRICMMMVNCVSEPRYTLLYSHGNAVDMGQTASFYIGLGKELKVNIFSYDYSGYGESEGKPSERNMYDDIDAAFFVLKTRFKLPPNKIVLYGQSIGTVPTVDLASKHEVAGVILHSPLLSGLRVACPETSRTWCCDSFTNVDKLGKVRSPVLVLHGTDDEVIDFTHGLETYDRLPVTVEPLWAEGAGHNDIELNIAYITRLKRFLHDQLPSLQDNAQQ